MDQSTSDASVDFVLEQIKPWWRPTVAPWRQLHLMVTRLIVKYKPGVNEECPECVPTLDMVTRFLAASLGIHAPYVTDIEVS